MARPNGLQPFFMQDHVQSHTQPIEVMGRRSAVEIFVKFGRIHTWPPIPIGRHTIGPFPRLIRFFREINKPNPGRGHQTLLAACDHHIHTPCVKFKRITGEAGDVVREQQRGVPRCIQGLPQG